MKGISKMKVTVEKDKLIIEIGLSPHPSKSGKTIVIASTAGNIPTTATYDGKPVILGLNAYVRK
jgi:hypothetical protein